MKKIFLHISLSLFLLPLAFAQAPDEEEFEDAPMPPELPEPLESGQVIEPEVTIVRTEKEIIEEYRVNGNLYMIKITPAAGPAYYLIDSDGDGQMEGRKMSSIYNPGQVPQWVLFTWD